MHTDINNGLRYAQNRDCIRAVPILENCVQFHPMNKDVHFWLGVCYFRKMNYSKAEDQFKKVIWIDGDSYFAHYYLALVYDRKNDTRLSIRELKITLTLKPDFREAIDKLNSYNSFRPPAVVSHINQPPSVQNLQPIIKESSQKKILPNKLIVQGHRCLSSFSEAFLIMLVSTPLVIIHPLLALIPALILAILILNSSLTYYRVWEDRIEIQEGILRQRTSLHMKEIFQIWIKRRSLTDYLTNNKTIYIREIGPGGLFPEYAEQRAERGVLKITGLGDAHVMEHLYEKIEKQIAYHKKM